ncbi:hypothetical protein HFP72_12745 [Nocardiopsis sp. ARC36]
MQEVNEEELDYPDDTNALLNGQPFTGRAIEYDDGLPVELTTYIDGREEGPRLTWSTEGQLLIQGNMSRSHGAVGPWHFWDEDGNLIREHIFDAAGNIRIIREWDETGRIIGEERHEALRGNRPVDKENRGPLRWR